MAQFETLVPTRQAKLFESMLWDFVARMLGCSVPVHVVRRYPDAKGDRWVVEMDDEARLEELAVEARELVSAAPTTIRRRRRSTDSPQSAPGRN
jgi:hypothetical protein